MESIDMHGFYRDEWNPIWNPWISMDSMDIHGVIEMHGFYGYPWNPRISMESLNIHGTIDIHRFFGYPWNPGISMNSMHIHGIHTYQ